MSYLSNKNATATLEAEEEIIQTLNIVMAKKVTSNPGVVPYMGNKYFIVENPGDETLSGKSLVALRGYSSSVRTSNSRILLNLNVCCSAFYNPTTLSAVMMDPEFLGAGPRPLGGWDKNIITRLHSFLKRVRVQTEYMKDKETGKPSIRVKTIKGLGRGDSFGLGAKDTTFQTDNGQSISVETYFMKSILYSITIFRYMEC